VNEDADIAAARDGSLPAFERLVRRHQGVVRGFLRRLAGDADQADDLAQEVFVLAWRKLGDFEARGTFRGWLCRVAYTRFLQHRRADLARARAHSARSDVPASGNADIALDLDRAMTTLSEDQRAAIALCYGEGLSHGEAAEVLGMPLGTVKSHVARGREKLVAALSGWRAA
jgi:RNA polymerase sigma-70 factor, ECF subfamily